MGFSYQERVSPKGRPYVRIELEGQIDIGDAEELLTRFDPGGVYYRKTAFVVVGPGTAFDVAARKRLLETRAEGLAVCVVKSPLARAAINLMLRAVNLHGKVRMYNQEPEALAWLDEQEA